MNAKPQRIQLSRRKGFKLQAVSMALNGLPAVNCARPSIWGNEFKVGTDYGYGQITAKEAVSLFSASIGKQRRIDIMKNLRGKNLACWCKLNQPCHCDILLAIGNQ